MSQGKKGKRSQKRLTDPEILELFLQRASNWRPFVETEKAKWLIKRFWMGMLVGAFVGGPLFGLAPVVGWFRLAPFWYWCIPMGINAVLLLIWALYFWLTSKKWLKPSGQQEQLAHYLGMGSFLYGGWMGLYVSLMGLLGSIGVFVRISGAPWWIPVLIYGAGGAGLWAGRKALLRAIVEGPEAHPWFRPIRLLFTTSLGFWVFLIAVTRLIAGGIKEWNEDVGLLLATGIGLAASMIPLGLAMIGWIISYLHYQKWRGARELRI